MKSKKDVGTSIKYSIQKFIPFALIMCGLALLASVGYMKWSVYTKQKAMIASYQALFNEESLLADSSAANPNPDSSSMILQEESGTQKRAVTPIALLKVPKINLYAAIAEGADKETIRYAVGHFPETALPGADGNFCLVGHRSYSYGEFFNRLDELTTGDLIYTEYNGMEYTYQITDKYVVEPTDTWVLDQSADAEITLITCTPIRIATHRLIIKGVLIASTPA